jgi:hypothetical protein
MVGKRATFQIYKDGWTVPSSLPLSVLVPANGVTDPVILRLVKAGKSFGSTNLSDLIADFSVLPADDPESLELFDIAYRANKDATGIHIAPKVPYLDLLAKGGPILPQDYWWTPFKVTLPELDIKLVNNSPKTVFLTEADFIIATSKLDTSPVLLIHGEGSSMRMGIFNLGWRPLSAPQFHFNLIPLSTEQASPDPEDDPEKLFQDKKGTYALTLPIQVICRR